MNNAYEFLYSKSARLGFGSWQVEKTLYKHSAGVTALVLHPSGKLAFSAAKDKKMMQKDYHGGQRAKKKIQDIDKSFRKS